MIYSIAERLSVRAMIKTKSVANNVLAIGQALVYSYTQNMQLWIDFLGYRPRLWNLCSQKCWFCVNRSVTFSSKCST